MIDCKNTLYLDDALQVLGTKTLGESVDQICFEPPFDSSTSYVVPLKGKSRKTSARRIYCFEDN
jgi:hypothetical protein